MYFRFTIIVLLVCFFFTASAQSDTTLRYTNHTEWKEQFLGLMVGYSGASYQYGEVGIGFGERGLSDHHPYGMAWFISCEMRLDNINRLAPKAGMWVAGNGSILGLNLLYYTGDGYKGMPCLRPEIGMGLSVFKLSYGYNLALANKDFNGINRHCVNVVVMLEVLKLKKN